MLTTLINNSFFSEIIWGNSILDYSIAIALFIIILAVLGVFYTIILKRLSVLSKKTENDIDDTLVKVLKTFRFPFYIFLSFYIGFKTLDVKSAVLEQGIDIILLLWVVFQIIKAVSVFVDYGFQKSVEKKGVDQMAVNLLGRIVKITLWIIGGLFILSNFGVNISSLVAGLGIGGIAIALALQNILGDLFSSFAIYFDKPFEVDDFIVVGTKKGIVKKIGIKTTRLKSPQGEEIVISNKDLTSSQIQNFGKMEERRVVFHIGVTYETSSSKLTKIPNLIQSIIDSETGVRFGRSHLQTFADSALVFETAYYVETDEYNTYMDMNQRILIKIKDALDKEKIDMAYPTQTLYIQK